MDETITRELGGVEVILRAVPEGDTAPPPRCESSITVTMKEGVEALRGRDFENYFTQLVEQMREGLGDAAEAAGAAAFIARPGDYPSRRLRVTCLIEVTPELQLN